MTTDGRHLRARWIIAATGWLLWAASITVPVPGMPKPLWSIYSEAMHAMSKLTVRPSSVSDVIDIAGLLGFAIASAVFALSPPLLVLNHSRDARARRCRWLGIGLLAMAQLTVMVIMRKGTGLWPAHLLVLSHLILCSAIIPWPRERVGSQSGFDVIIPTPKPTHAPPTTDDHW